MGQNESSKRTEYSNKNNTQPLDTDLTTIAGFAHAKGSIMVSNGTAWVLLPAGTDGQVLKANSATATGLEWAADATE